jgi:hypothetical protein
MSVNQVSCRGRVKTRGENGANGDYKNSVIEVAGNIL